MFGRKCSLCGGRLDSRKVCQECGLDNSKSEKYYQVNRSSCDHKPLTHVHEDDGRVRKAKNKPSGGTKEKKGKGCLTVILVLFFIGFIVPLIMGIFLGIKDEFSSGWEPETEYADPYEYLDVSNEETDWWTEFNLTSGEYIVGVHIPAGDYVATVSNDYDVVEVTDQENDIYLYEYLAKEGGNYLDDIRLFEGAVVTITTETEVVLQTGNVQEEVESIENPVTDSWFNDKYDSDESYTAGIEFEPGVYDLYTTDGNGFIGLTIYDTDGNEIDYRGFSLGENTDGGKCYKNLVIPEDAVILVDDILVDFIPSPMISSTDYHDYYNY